MPLGGGARRERQPANQPAREKDRESSRSQPVVYERICTRDQPIGVSQNEFFKGFAFISFLKFSSLPSSSSGDGHVRSNCTRIAQSARQQTQTYQSRVKPKELSGLWPGGGGSFGRERALGISYKPCHAIMPGDDGRCQARAKEGEGGGKKRDDSKTSIVKMRVSS